MVEKWRQCLGNGGVIITWPFNCKTYGLLTILSKCFKVNSQTEKGTKVNDADSKYCEILLGVLLLFNAYLCDIFYHINDCDIASYADDNKQVAAIRRRNKQIRGKHEQRVSMV